MSITAIQSQQGTSQAGQQYGTNASILGTAAGGSTSTPYNGLTGIPYYGYSPSYTTTSIVIEPDISLRKVENGWVLKMQGKEYVLTETVQVAKYLQLFEQSK